MKNYIQVFCIACLIVLIVGIQSCEEFVQVPAPSTEITKDAVFENDLSAKAAMASLYIEISGISGTFESLTAVGGFLADESRPYTTDPDFQQLFENNIVATNKVVEAFWRRAYSNIYNANAIIEGLTSSTKVTAAVKDQLMGEAKFIRAFEHFYLVNLFGDVPFVSTTDYRLNNVISQSTSEDVYAGIISDLQEAQTLLTYSVDGSERIVPDAAAATALLARVYLYIGDAANAELQATAVIDHTDLYGLEDLDNTFLIPSVETIWHLQTISPDINTNDGSTFILLGPPAFSALEAEFVNSFEAGDSRKDSWVGSYTDGIDTWYYPFKYKVQAGGDPLVEYSIVLRLAEQYLIRGEARAMQNKISDAIADVDAIRGRAGLPLLASTNPGIDKDNLLMVIEKERRSELFSEWGHRWLDLKRTHRDEALLGPIKPGWSPNDALFPIPHSEILVNGMLTQNPGY